MSANKVFLNDDGIIEIQVVGDQDKDSVEQMGRQISRQIVRCRAANKPVLVLDDITQIGNVDTDGRKTVIELGKKLDYDRLVMLGKGGLLQLGANFLLHATGKADKVKYVESRQAAVEWLKTY